MFCPKCNSELIFKKVPETKWWEFWKKSGNKEYVCPNCGVIHFRYVLENINEEEKRMKYIFYEEQKMPCCGSKSFIEGPTGGLCINIKCTQCNTWFNITPILGTIEKIK